VKQQYRGVWDASLTGGCNYYRASPLRPPRPETRAPPASTLPREMLTVDIPTLVLWAMEDTALPPELVDGLDDYVPQLTLEKVPGARTGSSTSSRASCAGALARVPRPVIDRLSPRARLEALVHPVVLAGMSSM
jgi:pimeloyl-ACP methyl ester carboxylesterase